jgi:hypothetical protein
MARGGNKNVDEAQNGHVPTPAEIRQIIQEREVSPNALARTLRIDYRRLHGILMGTVDDVSPAFLQLLASTAKTIRPRVTAAEITAAANLFWIKRGHFKAAICRPSWNRTAGGKR